MVLGHDLTKGQRTLDIQISQDVSFDTMLLRRETLEGLKNAGFLKPSPIQLHGIPLGKCGFDLLLEAKSGTGKTAVFTVIALEKINLNLGVQTIVLAPTREIASQISDVISNIGSYYRGLNVAVVMGGLPFEDDVEKFNENVHVVVGSPGRLRHLIKTGSINISSVRQFVLDEADKLMENTFLPDINYIFTRLPKQKQVIMSSATYPNEVKSFINKYVQKAQHVCPDSNSVLLGIEQKVTSVPYHSNIIIQTKHKYDELKNILNVKQFKQCLIFCNYQVRVGELHKMLARDKWPAEQLYGQQEQTDRLDALKTLQEYKCRILISTDLAARGIDAANVDIVINFEPPLGWQTYLHRIGRAGRYGSYGTSITILSKGKEELKFKETLGLTNIPFHLKDFWNDEPFSLDLDTRDENINEDNPCIETPKVKVDDTKDLLWQVLNTNSPEQKENKAQIFSFEGLFESFKIANTPIIETFSELISSFSENQNKSDKIKNSINYKHVKINKLPIDNKLLKFFGLYQADKTITNITSEHKTADTINNIKITCTSTDNPAHKENEHFYDGMNKKHPKDFNDDVSVQMFDNCLSNVAVQKSCKVIKSYRTVEDDNEQALIKANLPPCFGKPLNEYSCMNSKRSHYYKRIFKNKSNIKLDKPQKQQRPSKEHINKEKKEDFKSKNKKGLQMSYQSIADIKVNHVEPSYTSEENSQSDYSDDINEDFIPETRKNYIRNGCNTYPYQNNSKYYLNNQACNRSKQFDIWYSQLKYQMQYIQHALYIEELRKL